MKLHLVVKVFADIFSKAVRNLLEKGRGKHRNILIKGPANMGKNPINVVFQSFSNPATSTFAWVGQKKQR